MPDYLTEKYNVPAPRYTSYPTMPYWDTHKFTNAVWKNSVQWAREEEKKPA